MAASKTKDTGFKLPGSSLDEVFKAIQGYATVGKPASLSDISKNTGMHPTIISKNVGFLLSVGILEGGQNKAPTVLGLKLGLALMHNVPEEVESILADLVAENEFLKNVLAAVRIRKGMDSSSLRSHIAYSAGQSKTGSTATGTGAVVELLKRSGHIKEEDGKLIVGAPVARTAADAASPEKASATVASPAIATVPNVSLIRADSPFSIVINLEVRCGPEDLDDLGARLRKVVKDFSFKEADVAGEE